ncbi:MAG: penicillin-binding protein 2 [Clostridia bacterium]|nr:penicillin-binding protein 2 [Clostridia bacterium]
MSKGRLLFIKIVLVLMIGAIIWRLYDMQVINGEGYKNLSDQRISANITQKAPRGEITDRNGKVLVTNRKGYSIKLQKTSISDEDFNAMLLKLFNILDEDGYVISDSLPITAEPPYAYTFASDEQKAEWFEDLAALDASMTADELLEYYRKAYKISSELGTRLIRRLSGLRYEIKKSGFSINSPFVIADDVSATVVSKIKERQNEFEGVTVTQEYFRQYTQGQLAAHILGRIGKIYKEEYDELKDKGYAMSDLVGKQGIEKVCEDYLRGTDGSKNVYYGEDSELLGDETDIPAVPGNYVVLTIDSNLQRAAEESLERNIKQIAESGKDKDKKGGDADSGAAVVIDVKTGDILALATYPTYDPAKFSESYNDLLSDPAKPLWNRAISGTYTPGSTFKPLTAIAALSTGAISVNEQISCDGVYTFFEDYQPKCWIWTEQHKTHGMLDVTKAIENSCNCFFYETGRRVGIDAIDQYAKKLGLGERTGIELAEEASGNVASPDYKKTLYEDAADRKWVGGDTIQTAIGQSYSAFTPIGLANYAATIANGGTRYRTHIIKSVHSSTDGSLVYESEPVVMSNVEISEDNLNAVLKGMLGVADEGSAKQIFNGYPISVGGKTGTAQISKKASNNALFISFAPFEAPEIAVCVVIEHGYRGANAAYVARDIYNEYFGLTGNENAENAEESNNMTIVSELLP